MNWFEKSFSMKKKLSEGAFGKVFYAVHRQMGIEMAVKKMCIRNATSRGVNIHNEAYVLNHLKHHNIVGVFVFEEVDEHAYLCMEYVNGGDLHQLVVGRKARLPECVARMFFKQLPIKLSDVHCISLTLNVQIERVVDAVAYMHAARFVHLDIKPPNILLHDRVIVKLGDFGLARKIGETDKLIREQNHPGDPQYMPPEILRNEAFDGFKADVWSLGVTLYVLLTRCTPFTPSEYRERLLTGNYNKDLITSPLAQQFLDKMIVVNPECRLSLDSLKKDEWLSLHNRILEEECIAWLDTLKPSSMPQEPVVKSNVAEASVTRDPQVGPVNPSGVSHVAQNAQPPRRMSYVDAVVRNTQPPRMFAAGSRTDEPHS